MSTPVTFATLPNGRIEALIGNTVVGSVSVWCLGHSEEYDASFRFYLPVDGGSLPAFPAKTTASAKRSLISKIADWHEQSDPIRYAVMIKELRDQAEGERG